MNREIKFRSFVEHTDSTGGHNNYSYMNYDLDFHGSVNEIFAQSSVKPLNPLHNKITYMQYTGLQDKNGKEIYEGDIIEGHTFDERINEKQIGKIAYNEDRHGFVFIPIWMEPKNLYYPLFSVVTCELIGNIYENPELLEETA